MPSKLVVAGLGAVVTVLVLTHPLTVRAVGLITGKDVKNESLTGADVRDGSLRSRDFGEALPSGAPGPAGPSGVPGSSGAPGPSGPPGPTYPFAVINGPMDPIVPGQSPVIVGPWGTLHLTNSARLVTQVSTTLRSASQSGTVSLGLCAQETSTPTPGPVFFADGGNSHLMALDANWRNLSLSGVSGPVPPGVYHVGMCALNASAFFSTDDSSNTVVGWSQAVPVDSVAG
jgi:hypothetical protein